MEENKNLNNEGIQLYDNIVNSCMINTFSMSKDGIIILKGFNPDIKLHGFMFEVAKITSTLFPPRLIVLDMPLVDYLKFKYKNRKIKLGWGRRKKYRNCEFEFENMLEFVRTSYDVANDIFEEIYNEYWKGNN